VVPRDLFIGYGQAPEIFRNTRQRFAIAMGWCQTGPEGQTVRDQRQWGGVAEKQPARDQVERSGLPE
jgi:hypothetical protein